MGGEIKGQVFSSGTLQLQLHEGDGVIFGVSGGSDPLLARLINLFRAGWYIDIDDSKGEMVILLPPDVRNSRIVVKEGRVYQDITPRI